MTISNAIKKKLGYSYKKLYYNSNIPDENKILPIRYWISFELF